LNEEACPRSVQRHGMVNHILQVYWLK